MNVSIFGLGYVGAVTAGCLVERGCNVVGVDVQEGKVQTLRAGRSPIVEPELEPLLQQGVAHGKLKATSDAAAAVAETSVSVICVGTPSNETGRLNLEFVRKVSGQIQDALRSSGKKHTIVYRSTMLPGSTRKLADEFFGGLRKSGQVHIYFCPEFLREGSAVKDFREPALAIFGTDNGQAPDQIGITELFSIASPLNTLTWENAEMLKYACNYFHALKIGFANEIGRLCKHLGQDAGRLMNVFCWDEKLNISPQYLQPGTPFGGSCLPKDISALTGLARAEGLNLPILEHVQSSNQAHIDLLLHTITKHEKRRIGLLGLTFKADTDDLRNSPMVTVAEALLGRGYDVKIFDPELQLHRLVGANASQIYQRMPHLAQLLRKQAHEVVAASDVIVASRPCTDLVELTAAAHAQQHVIDVHGWSALRELPWRYEGLCW